MIGFPAGPGDELHAVAVSANPVTASRTVPAIVACLRIRPSTSQAVLEIPGPHFTSDDTVWRKAHQR
jgi:hypothetical protein